MKFSLILIQKLNYISYLFLTI